MKHTSLIAIIAALVQLPSMSFGQSVTFNIDAEVLKTSGGAPMPITGLVMLVADTSVNGFSGPTDTAFVNGDDLELMRWSLDSTFGPGVFQKAANNLPLLGSWDANDPVQLYWFPTLTVGSATPGAGTSYGQYRDAVGLDMSDIWVTPSAGGTVDLKFFTSDATFLHSGGSNPDSAGDASLTTVPEPSAYSAVFAMLCLAGVVVRRKMAQPAFVSAPR
jgi:hypothetical protein